MRYVLISAFAILMLFSACTEKGPLIIFGSSVARDTVYTTSTETPQSHNVLVEEFTGAQCPNCPGGHVTLRNLSGIYPNRLNIIAIHVNGFPQAQPVPGAKYDFRTTVGTNLEGAVFGSIIGEPSAGLDRISWPGILSPNNPLLPYPTDWPGDVATRIAVSNTVNLYVQSSYDASTNKVAIQAKIAFTQLDTSVDYLNLAIVEDSLYDLQDSTGAPGPISNYLFNNILRDMVTPYTGDRILDTISAKQPGLVNVRNYNYTFNTTWNPQHCRVIAFIARNGAQKAVLQSTQCKLAP